MSIARRRWVNTTLPRSQNPYMYKFINLYMYRWIHIDICICIIYIYIYVYMYICMYTYISINKGRVGGVDRPPPMGQPPLFFFFLLLSSLELNDAKVYEPWIRALLGTASPKLWSLTRMLRGCARLVVWTDRDELSIPRTLRMRGQWLKRRVGGGMRHSRRGWRISRSRRSKAGLCC